MFFLPASFTAAKLMQAKSFVCFNLPRKLKHWKILSLPGTSVIHAIYEQLHYQISDINLLTSDVHSMTDPNCCSLTVPAETWSWVFTTMETNWTLPLLDLFCIHKSLATDSNCIGNLSHSALKQFVLQRHKVFEWINTNIRLQSPVIPKRWGTSFLFTLKMWRDGTIELDYVLRSRLNPDSDCIACAYREKPLSSHSQGLCFYSINSSTAN